MRIELLSLEERTIFDLCSALLNNGEARWPAAKAVSDMLAKSRRSNLTTADVNRIYLRAEKKSAVEKCIRDLQARGRQDEAALVHLAHVIPGLKRTLWRMARVKSKEQGRDIAPLEIFQGLLLLPEEEVVKSVTNIGEKLMVIMKETLACYGLGFANSNANTSPVPRWTPRIDNAVRPF